MEQHTIDKIEKLFADLVAHEMKYSNGVYLVVLVTNEGWEYPLPDELHASEYMSLVITGWSKEQSFVVENGLFIQLAFGDNENSKVFKWSEIKGIYTEKGVPIMVKSYDLIVTPEVVEVPNIQLKDIMHDSEGVKKSMSIMRKLNPKKGK